MTSWNTRVSRFGKGVFFPPNRHLLSEANHPLMRHVQRVWIPWVMAGDSLCPATAVTRHPK